MAGRRTTEGKKLLKLSSAQRRTQSGRSSPWTATYAALPYLYSAGAAWIYFIGVLLVIRICRSTMTDIRCGYLRCQKKGWGMWMAPALIKAVLSTAYMPIRLAEEAAGRTLNRVVSTDPETVHPSSGLCPSASQPDKSLTPIKAR